MLFLDAITRAIDRLAHCEGYSVTAVIEELAASAASTRQAVVTRVPNIA
jgi:hypothetical protein